MVEELQRKILPLKMMEDMTRFYSDISVACKYVNLETFSSHRNKIQP